MYVMAGSHRVEVTIEANLCEGEKPVSDVFKSATMQIVLDAGTPRDLRRTALANALAKAWDYACGEIEDDDEPGREERIKAIDEQLNADLVNQHGEGVLHQLFGEEGEALADNLPGEPLRVPYSSDESGSGWPTDVACPTCNQIHKEHQILNGPPFFDVKENGFAMERFIFCKECGKDSDWVQRCSFDGVPWPKVVSGPRSVRRQLEDAARAVNV